MAKYSFLLLILLLSPAAYPEPTPSSDREITFTCSLAMELPLTQKLLNYYRAAFAELGYDFDMQHRPPKRALIEAVTGRSDGECARVPGFLSAEHSAQLIEIDVIIGQSAIHVWSTQDRPFSLQELENADYIIGYNEGSQFSAHLAHRLGNGDPLQKPHLQSINTTETALKMLASGRLTHFLGVNFDIATSYEALDLPESLYDSGRLAEFVAKPYLHRRHRQLAPLFTAELKKIVAEKGIINTR